MHLHVYTNNVHARVPPDIHSRVVYILVHLGQRSKAFNILCTFHTPHQRVMDKSRAVQHLL